MNTMNSEAFGQIVTKSRLGGRGARLELKARINPI